MDGGALLTGNQDLGAIAKDGQVVYWVVYYAFYLGDRSAVLVK